MGTDGKEQGGSRLVQSVISVVIVLQIVKSRPGQRLVIEFQIEAADFCRMA